MINMKLISIVLILISSVFLGCVQTPVDTPMPMTKELAFETIEKSESGGFGARQNYVVNNSSEWANLWNKLKPYERPPTVDFSQYMVFAVFQGGQTSGGFHIVITKIIETEKTVDVFVKEVSPRRECIVTMATTAPYYI
jgi:hypothetical protein